MAISMLTLICNVCKLQTANLCRMTCLKPLGMQAATIHLGETSRTSADHTCPSPRPWRAPQHHVALILGVAYAAVRWQAVKIRCAQVATINLGNMRAAPKLTFQLAAAGSVKLQQGS